MHKAFVCVCLFWDELIGTTLHMHTHTQHTDHVSVCLLFDNDIATVKVSQTLRSTICMPLGIICLIFVIITLVDTIGAFTHTRPQ